MPLEPLDPGVDGLPGAAEQQRVLGEIEVDLAGLVTGPGVEDEGVLAAATDVGGIVDHAPVHLQVHQVVAAPEVDRRQRDRRPDALRSGAPDERGGLEGARGGDPEPFHPAPGHDGVAGIRGPSCRVVEDQRLSQGGPRQLELVGAASAGHREGGVDDAVDPRVVATGAEVDGIVVGAARRAAGDDDVPPTARDHGVGSVARRALPRVAGLDVVLARSAGVGVVSRAEERAHALSRALGAVDDVVATAGIHRHVAAACSVCQAHEVVSEAGVDGLRPVAQDDVGAVGPLDVRAGLADDGGRLAVAGLALSCPRVARARGGETGGH